MAGRYRLGPLLGRGGMGRVWLAEDELLGRQVALKEVLFDTGPGDPHGGALRRARDEAHFAARAEHAGVVRVHDLVQHAGLPWIVMELLPGRTLAEVMRTHGPLTVPEVARIGLHLVDALRATHAAGVVHRDVKPANVHLCPNGRVVLTDFGIACPVGDDGDADGGLFKGSPGYASPERLRGEPPAPADDLFSLGATLFAAVEGRSAFTRDGMLATIAAVVTQDPPPLLRGEPLRDVVAGLLAKDSRLRTTTDAAATALRAVLRRRPPGRSPGAGHRGHVRDSAIDTVAPAPAGRAAAIRPSP